MNSVNKLALLFGNYSLILLVGCRHNYFKSISFEVLLCTLEYVTCVSTDPAMIYNGFTFSWKVILNLQNTEKFCGLCTNLVGEHYKDLFWDLLLID
jgi:hypothetical protein